MGIRIGRGKHSERCSVESGSLLPLMIFIFFISLLAFMTGVNLYSAKVSKFRLESWGEDFVASLFSEISYERYFFDPYINIESRNRIFIPVDCGLVLQNVGAASRNFPRKISIEKVKCDQGQLKLVLAQPISFPFLGEAFFGIEPKVVVHISGGLQRVRAAR